MVDAILISEQRMKNIVFGVILTLFLLGIGILVYRQLQPKDFGSLKVIVLAPNGKPATEIEVDINTKPGPPKFRLDTDKNGVAFFEQVPVGNYAIYFNKGNFPPVFEYPQQTYWVGVDKDKITEKVIELRPAPK